MRFTEEQQRIIEHRGGELLVSAAAGSGKTAVLVERIIKRILDEQQPLSIDRILVVTFTKAAAAEMKERITMSIEQALIEDPINEHLREQMLLLPNAKITTIHSFCLSVIRDYFDVIDLEPDFRVADETEVKLLQETVLEDIIEQAYEHASPNFLKLVECCAGGKHDRQLSIMVKQLSQMALSMPYPKAWLKTHLLDSVGLNEALENVLYHHVMAEIQHVDVLLEKLKSRIELPGGPHIYREVHDIYKTFVQEVMAVGANDTTSLFRVFGTFEKQKLSSSKKDMDAILREECKAILDEIHQMIPELKQMYFFVDYETMVKDHDSLGEVYQGLYELVEAFQEAFDLEKRRRKIIDFSDIEHMALTLLTTLDAFTGQYKPSDIAYAYDFDEIMIDEYQDSSLVQEAILRSVSSEKSGNPNMFMVGDVKQSIYKFRMAKPELFLDKYDRYQEDGVYIKRHLTKNFRSRHQVIDAVNHVFEHLMIKDFGGVDYDDKSRLYVGFPYEDQPDDHKAQYLLIDREAYEESDKTVLEAVAIGNSIKQFVDQPYIIYDKAAGKYRQASYRDIVILHRSPKQFAPKLLETLSAMGIPAHAGFSSGYFTSLEVLTVMNLLRVIDNPDQDIPLAAVLKSPVVGLSDEALANVRLAFSGGSFYMAMKQYLKGMLEDQQIQDVTYEKLLVFSKRLQRWQNQAKYLRIDRLLTDILSETDYLLFLSLEHDGQKKIENINLLMNRAISYGDTSFQGIFNFIKYVDYMERYDIEMDEASTLSEYDNVVRVMSIHKSKGLEFPIVFLAGMSKLFNTRDLKENLILHQDYGIGGEFVDLHKRYRMPTLKKQLIKQIQKQEMLEEELRILYVAMTRAREKLVMVGVVKNLDKALEKWQSAGEGLHHMLKSTSYQDWVMPVIIKDQGSIEQLSGDALRRDMLQQIGIHQLALESVNNDQINAILSWSYPYSKLTKMKINRSVSELKKLKGKAFTEDGGFLNMGPIGGDITNTFKLVTEEVSSRSPLETEILFEPTVPRFRSKKLQEETVTAAGRGTAYHEFLYLVDIHMPSNHDTIEEIKRTLYNDGLMDQRSIELIDNNKIVRLFQQPLWEKVKASKQVFKESPFVLGERPSVFDSEAKDVGYVMVQGVVDLYFIDDDGLTVVDYKTDQIRSGQESVLISRYEEQLAIYADALSRAYDLPVSHKYIYAMALDQFIEV